MAKQAALFVGVVAGLLVCTSVTPARLLDSWPYDKLFKEADLVVIADAVKTEAAEDKPPEHTWPYEFVAQNTTFKVTHTLKGKAGEQIKVLHFKFGILKKGIDPKDPKDFENRLIMDGPLLVTFRSEIAKVTVDGKKRVLTAPEYLLFLRKLKDGRYEPVSGRIDPELSVREISRKMDEVLGGTR